MKTILRFLTILSVFYTTMIHNIHIGLLDRTDRRLDRLATLLEVYRKNRLYNTPGEANIDQLIAIEKVFYSLVQLNRTTVSHRDMRKLYFNTLLTIVHYATELSYIDRSIDSYLKSEFERIDTGVRAHLV